MGMFVTHLLTYFSILEFSNNVKKSNINKKPWGFHFKDRLP